MIKRYFRKKSLIRDSSTQPTGLIPAGDVKYMTVILDAGEPDAEKCRDTIIAYCKKTKIDLNLIYLDFRRFNRKVRPSTDKDMTIFRSDLNWFGKPSDKKSSLLKDNPCDLYICLADYENYCIEYLSKAVTAKFKVGRRAFKGNTFDMVVSNSADDTGTKTADEVFKAVTNLMAKII